MPSDADLSRPKAAVLCGWLLGLGVLGAALCLAYALWHGYSRPEDLTRSEIVAWRRTGDVGLLIAYGFGFLAFLGWWGRRRILRKRYHNAEGLIWAIVIVAVLTLVVDRNHNYFFDPQSSSIEIVRQTTYLGIFALGAAVVIIAGGIDLSSGSMIAFSATICACLMTVLAPDEMKGATDLPWHVGPIAIAGTLFVGFLVGTLHSWLITSIGLPPFIATLATLVGLRSLARALIEYVTEAQFGSKTTQIQIYDASFRYLATSIWIPLVLFVVIAIGLWLLLAYTVVGRHLYALGGNEQAARLSGIRTESVKWLAYCIGTLTASIAGILYMCDQSVADPQTLGVGYELRAIASAVVGGCSLQGGAGTVIGTVLGALFLRTVIDGVAKVIKTGSDVYEGLIVGIVVVVAVAFSQLRDASGTKKTYFAGVRGVFAIIALAAFAGILATVLARTYTDDVLTQVNVGLLIGTHAFALLLVVKLSQWVYGSGATSLSAKERSDAVRFAFAALLLGSIGMTIGSTPASIAAVIIGRSGAKRGRSDTGLVETILWSISLMGMVLGLIGLAIQIVALVVWILFLLLSNGTFGSDVAILL